MRPSSNYRQALLAIVLAASFSAAGWTQDADEPDNEEVVTEDPAVDESATEEIDVDDGSYLDAEEDDFRPSEEIPADQSIPFPTDI